MLPIEQLPIPLLEWYRDNARTLPWREDPTPYHVWVSEIMLQQTRVAAVLDYYARFMAELPDVAALAQVPEGRLMKLWQGLGYYSRARNLQKAARQIMDQFGGVFPNTYEGIRSLAGVGDYTAGAIASIAFGIPEPAVDGNVLRVLSRVLASREDISRQAVKRGMEELVRGVIPPDRAGDFNQALIEVGGAKSVQACASHGVLSGPAIDRINDSVITELALLDTIPAIDPKKSSKIKYLPVAPMFAEAIERIYQEISVSKLWL